MPPSLEALGLSWIGLNDAEIAARLQSHPFNICQFVDSVDPVLPKHFADVGLRNLASLSLPMVYAAALNQRHGSTLDDTSELLVAGNAMRRAYVQERHYGGRHHSPDQRRTSGHRASQR